MTDRDRDRRPDAPRAPPATERMETPSQSALDRPSVSGDGIPRDRPSGAFLWTADDGPPPPFDSFPMAPPLEDETFDPVSAEDSISSCDQAPRAVRPIGRLGGTEAVGFALSHPVALSHPAARSERVTGRPRPAPPGQIADDDDVPEDELPPTLPPRYAQKDEPLTRHVTRESEKLEIWLLNLIAKGVPRQTEAERLEAWLQSLDMAKTAQAERRRP